MEVECPYDIHIHEADIQACVAAIEACMEKYFKEYGALHPFPIRRMTHEDIVALCLRNL